MRSNSTNSFIALGLGGSLGFGYVLQLYLVYNHKFAKYSTTTIGREKMSTIWNTFLLREGIRPKSNHGHSALLC